MPCSNANQFLNLLSPPAAALHPLLLGLLFLGRVEVDAFLVPRAVVAGAFGEPPLLVLLCGCRLGVATRLLCPRRLGVVVVVVLVADDSGSGVGFAVRGGGGGAFLRTR